MNKKRVLIVTQEMQPYTETGEISSLVRELAPYVQDHNMEIRVLMPRFGTINERRHRLHEVVRLSGMNIIVDDDDYPLIIKVASLQEARMQVYFLDNDDFFRRKYVFRDGHNKVYEDNVDRMVFFCKGVLETVKKFGWAPDLVHCHGWMTSLIPLYLKTAYRTEPLFQHARVVYSVYESEDEALLADTFTVKASINNLSESDLQQYYGGSGATVHEGAFAYSDGLVLNSETHSPGVTAALDKLGKPILQATPDLPMAAYLDFYQVLLGQ